VSNSNKTNLLVGQYVVEDGLKLVLDIKYDSKSNTYISWIKGYDFKQTVDPRYIRNGVNLSNNYEYLENPGYYSKGTCKYDSKLNTIHFNWKNSSNLSFIQNAFLTEVSNFLITNSNLKFKKLFDYKNGNTSEHISLYKPSDSLTDIGLIKERELKLAKEKFQQENYIVNGNVGSTIIIDNLEIPQRDFLEKVNLYGAVEICEDLGNGWRLPTQKELMILFFNKDKIGGFQKSRYWCYTSNEGNNVDFKSGYSLRSYDQNEFRVRPIRISKLPKTQLDSLMLYDNFKSSIRIDTLEIARNDFGTLMKWEDAINKTKELGNGWRLPTKEELKIMFKNKEKISWLKSEAYWSSSSESLNKGRDCFDCVFTKHFSNGYENNINKNQYFFVRVVRTISK
jgi:hypothetical protein